MKKANRKNRKFENNNIPLQEETLLLRKYIFEKFSKANKFILKSNLSNYQINCIKKYFETKPFIICNSDKNVGWVIMDKEMYNSLSLKHLNENDKVYKKLNHNPLISTFDKLNDKLIYLLNNGHISQRFYKQLIPRESCKPGKFKILIKLHKKNFGIRPIINNINHPTECLSYFLDLFLQPYVKSSKSYIKDSQNLIQFCEDLEYDKKKYFKYSCDFESLYTNIDTEDAIELITYHFKNSIDNFDFSIVALNEILKLVLNNNIFSFNNSFYIQLNGLAMGSKCGPTIANTYVSILEENWLNLYQPKVYKRFIDDIFILSDYEIDLSILNSSFKNLKLNTIYDFEVQFLDLLISNDPNFNRIKFRLYLKPTNTFQYLYSSSNHPSHIFKNIPKSLFIRIRRICTEYIDYLYFSRKLIAQLLKRGYKYEFLIKICLSIGKEERKELLPYKNKEIVNRIYCKNNFKYIINYDLNYIDLKKDFNQISINLKDNFKWLKDFKFSVLFSSSENFNKVFINYSRNNKFLNDDSISCINTCKILDCYTCSFLFNKNFIKINTFQIPVINNRICNTSNIIYILICVRCNYFYIGQSGRNFKIRFSEHIKNILGFMNLSKNNSEVASHFNLKRHNYKTDLKFCIFKKDIYNLEHRLSIETDLINIFMSLKFKILNAKIPNIKYISKFAFS